MSGKGDPHKTNIQVQIASFNRQHKHSQNSMILFAAFISSMLDTKWSICHRRFPNGGLGTEILIGNNRLVSQHHI